MKDQRIFANLIEAKMQQQPDLDVLTFVNIKPCGGFEDEKRSYRDLWEQGQRVNQALLEQNMERYIERMPLRARFGTDVVYELLPEPDETPRP